MASPAWPPPMISVSTCSTAMALAFSARSGLGCGANDPAAKRGKVALLGAKTAIDQVPAHALGHAERKRRDQPPGGEVVVDIGADAHGNAEAVDGGLQRLAVELKLRPARGDAGDGGVLQPGRPVIRRMRDAQQGRALEVARALEAAGEPGRADRRQVGGK